MSRTVIDKQSLCRMFSSAASSLAEGCALLCDIDSRFGDGDHGVAMLKISEVMGREAGRWLGEPGTSIGDFLGSLGDAIMAAGGGSAGPLYGTLVGGLGAPLSEETEIGASELKAMLRGALDAMYEITDARVGDKTMMDALIPAVEAAESAPDEIDSILLSAAEGAERGARDSEKYVSKYGRARSYKEQTIGTPDAGAMSTAIFFRGLAGPQWQ